MGQKRKDYSLDGLVVRRTHHNLKHNKQAEILIFDDDVTAGIWIEVNYPGVDGHDVWQSFCEGDTVVIRKLVCGWEMLSNDTNRELYTISHEPNRSLQTLIDDSEPIVVFTLCTAEQHRLEKTDNDFMNDIVFDRLAEEYDGWLRHNATEQFEQERGAYDGE